MKKLLLTLALATTLIQIGPNDYVDTDGNYFMRLPTGNIASTNGNYYIKLPDGSWINTKNNDRILSQSPEDPRVWMQSEE